MSVPWVSGGRVAPRLLEQRLAAALVSGRHDSEVTRATARCVRAWRQAGESLGPASGAGAVWHHVVQPITEALGWRPIPGEGDRLSGIPCRVGAAFPGDARVTLITLPWGASQDGLRRAATRRGASEGCRWAGVCNGTSWRWYDASRPFAAEHVALDLMHATADARVWQALWWLGQRATSPRSAATPLWLDRLVGEAATEAAGEARALRDGVATALTGLARLLPASHEARVSQVFQWLFLLFADARGMRPRWHPAYRRSYSIATVAAEGRQASTPPTGIHESLVAIARLGRDGGAIGGLPIPALGGPLFDTTPLARASPTPSDRALGTVLESLTHGGRPPRPHPLDFAALAVEHLGSVYEHLMAPPAAATTPALLRKRTGAFYTPRSLADVLVQRTLGPLVRDAPSARILGLRVLDPAMGSGALLASAHRFMTEAVEAAWVREGRSGPLDVPRAEREALPRRIAEQCLFGVDVNPHAVQVARLSLWLLSLVPDRPLTWLDAHVRVGNSLIGASPSLVLDRAPTGAACRRPRDGGQLTLFDLTRWHHEAQEVAPLFAALAARATDTVGDARDKAGAFAALRARGDLAMWRARADAWCGAAMERQAQPAAWRAVDAHLRDPALPLTRPLDEHRQRWQDAARAQACLHWTLEFPDVFDAGRGGFDAVIANPPWEMLRGDLGSAPERAVHRDDLGPLLRFVLRSGLYRQARGHINSYQLFVERMLHLVRRGGRLGCLLPGSVLTDQGAAPLRTHLFDQTAVDALSILGNRDGLFPIHRSMRVVSVTATHGSATDALVVDDGADVSTTSAVAPTRPARLLPRALLRRAGGASEPVPSLRDGDELAVLERLLAAPRLGGDEWGLRFGRELNATDDRGRLCHTPGHDRLVVVDGKHLRPFSVQPPVDGPWIVEAEALAVLPGAAWRRWRLAYRDVSGPGNARSLIAALLPPGCVSTHTVFCLRNVYSLRAQLYLCGLFNSLPADWFVRRYLGSHVTTRLIATLPAPQPAARHPRRGHVVRLVTRLMRNVDDIAAFVELQAIAAALYGLDGVLMEVVLRDFPRLEASTRQAILGRVRTLAGSRAE